MGGFGIGTAITIMKNGGKVARRGWNGKNMFAYYVPANTYKASGNLTNTMVGMYENDMIPYRPYLALKTAQNDIATWNPSTSDILADDWYEVV